MLRGGRDYSRRIAGARGVAISGSCTGRNRRRCPCAQPAAPPDGGRSSRRLRLRLRVGRACARRFRLCALLRRVRPAHDGDLLRRLERKVLVLEALQQHGRAFDHVASPAPDAVAAAVEFDSTRRRLWRRLRRCRRRPCRALGSYSVKRGYRPWQLSLARLARRLYERVHTLRSTAQRREGGPVQLAGYRPQRRRRRRAAAGPANP